MTRAPRHSVIIPAYNAPRTIGTTIESALGQSVTDLELIVVDDGSADETPSVVSSYAAEDPRVRLIRQRNAGTSAARNRGLAEAGGELVSLLDNDDAWLPDHLARAAATLDQHPEAGLAYADAWIFDDRSKRVRRRTSLSFYEARAAPDADVDELFAALLRKNFIIASSTTMTRRALRRVGRFDPGLKGVDDWDMWLRMASAGFTAKLSGAVPTVLLRSSDDSQSSDLAMMVRGNTQVLERVLEREPEGSRAHQLALGRLEEDQRWLRALASPTPRQAIDGFLRRRLGPIRRAALDRRDWMDAPAAVREAIPELAGGDTGGPGN